MEMYKNGNDKSWLLTIISLMITISAMLFESTIAGDSEAGLTWTIPAANLAESVAAINCSGHGKAFIDGIVIDGIIGKEPEIQCQCNTCYTGSDCSKHLLGCPADAAVGDAMFLEDYWAERQKVSSAILISGWSRMSYFTSGPDYISIELEKYIRRLHRDVGNAVVNDKYIVFGNGVTQLINLFIRALTRPGAKELNPKTLNVVARAPYYSVFRNQTELFDGKHYQWMGDAMSYVNTTTPSKFVEFVTSPNNPDGHFSEPVINGSLVINDNVYYWPHYAPIIRPLDEDIMMFAMSKFTGHAGSRLGWAFVRDLKLQKAVAHEYMALNSEGSSHDAQQRALILLKDVVKNIESEDRSNDISHYGYRKMMSRWAELEDVISKSDHFSLQSRPRRYCKYMKIYRRLTPGFAWLKCNYMEAKSCYDELVRGGIKSVRGDEYGADSSYARLSIIKTRDDFDQLIGKLKILVEKGPRTSM